MINKESGIPDMPLGLMMEFSKDINAMSRFSSFSQEEKINIINKAKNVSSKEEMKAVVSELSSENNLF